MTVARSATDRILEQAVACHQAGRLNEAERTYRHLLAGEPGHADGLNLLGVLNHQTGRNQAAARLIAAAITINGGLAEFHSHLGIVMKAMGQAEAALACYRRAGSLAPHFADAPTNACEILLGLGRPGEARQAARYAIALSPDLPAAYHNASISLRDLGATAEALVLGRQTVILDPQLAAAWNGLGGSLLDRQRIDFSIDCLYRSIILQPATIEFLQNLASTLIRQGSHRQAEQFLRRVLQMAPKDGKAGCTLTGLYQDAHRFAEAEVVAGASGNDGLAIRIKLTLPRLLANYTQIEEVRRRLSQSVSELIKHPLSAGDPVREIGCPLFYLAYHGLNDRPLIEAAHHALRLSCPSLDYRSPWLDKPRRQTRLRIGFISAFLFGHTIGLLNQGLIRKLDRRRFEVIVIHTADARQDDIRSLIDQSADRIVVLPDKLTAARKMIAELKLDILHFPDLGMDPFTYYLAFARLAPVQTTCWGHPNTMGLDSIDYFLSFATAETVEADDHYHETLVRLDRPCVYYEPLIAATTGCDRASFGLPADRTLYGCPQSLFKFHPDFDQVLGRILQEDPKGLVVTLEGHHPRWTQLLKERWREGHPDLEGRLLFLPRQATGRFLALQAQMDVLLDPLHFGGGNTFYESQLYGIPTVTWPSPFLRGRLATGFYRLMDMEEAPIAESFDDYVIPAAEKADSRQGACVR